MVLTNKNMYRMSEAAIAVKYSQYLQEIFIAELADKDDTSTDSDMQYFLGYEDFKDYYILNLVGKDNFIDKMVHEIQHNNSHI